MHFSDALKGWQIALEVNHAHRTIRDYIHRASQLCDYLNDPLVDAITTEDLTRFMGYLRHERKYAPATQRRGRIAIAAFYRWAETELELDRPDQAVPWPKVPQTEIVPFTHVELRNLIKASAYVDASGKRGRWRQRRPTALRDQCIIRVLFDTGVRVGELCRIQVGDVNGEIGKLRVRVNDTNRGATKTKPRDVPLGNRARSSIWKYMTERGQVFDSDPLFVTQRDNAMTTSEIQNLLRRIGERGGVTKVHPHRFRHSFAYWYLMPVDMGGGGGDPVSLVEILGHTSLKMARYYIRLTGRDLALMHRTRSPGDRARL